MKSPNLFQEMLPVNQAAEVIDAIEENEKCDFVCFFGREWIAADVTYIYGLFRRKIVSG